MATSVTTHISFIRVQRSPSNVANTITAKNISRQMMRKINPCMSPPNTADTMENKFPVCAAPNEPSKSVTLNIPTNPPILDPEAEYRYFFSFMYFMGTRKGEALALTWQDVDFANQEVRINKSLNRKQPEKGVAVVLATDPTPSSMGWHKINNRNYEVTTPKNKTSIRRVWMTESVLKILKDLRAESEKDYDFAETDFVFGGKLPLSDQTVRRKMDEYADKAGVKRIRVHDLRHSHASLVISQGLKIEDIILLSKRLGHRDIKETLNTYSHLFPNAQRRILEAIDKGAEM